MGEDSLETLVVTVPLRRFGKNNSHITRLKEKYAQLAAQAGGSPAGTVQYTAGSPEESEIRSVLKSMLPNGDCHFKGYVWNQAGGREYVVSEKRMNAEVTPNFKRECIVLTNEEAQRAGKRYVLSKLPERVTVRNAYEIVHLHQTLLDAENELLRFTIMAKQAPLSLAVFFQYRKEGAEWGGIKANYAK